VRPGELLAKRYELEKLVGTGGMSTVFRARDRELERTVALKVLHEKYAAEKDVLDRFRREAKLVAGLSHPNIVAVIDRGSHEGRPFIVFEYIAGENLKQLVGRVGPLPVERALELAIQVGRGLEFAHGMGFVHRDVKPQNVLLNGNGEAKVTDFGIARALEGHEGETQVGTVLGTCDYIAPEQAQGRRVDELTDVYSLGIVLYELLTGDVPFTGDNFVAIAMQHINSTPPSVTLHRRDVPARLDRAIEQALEKDPADRFETMSAFVRELEGCLADVRARGDTSATAIIPVIERRERRERRDRRVVDRLILAAAAVAILGGVAALAYTQGWFGAEQTYAPISVVATASYDPDGDNKVERPDLVSLATDGLQSTSWQTESYTDRSGSLFGKPGVGIVVDAGEPVALHTLTVTSSTPGFTAEVQAGDSRSGPFSPDSGSEVVGETTTFTLRGASARYYLVWITNRGSAPSVHIDEITARG